MSGRRGYFSGLAAEEIAESAYLERGCEVLARRWRSAAGEIDLIVLDDGVTVFIEVKSRASHTAASEAISRRQWQRVATSAQVFMSETGRDGGDMRFDAALVDASGKLELIENAAIWE